MLSKHGHIQDQRLKAFLFSLGEQVQEFLKTLQLGGTYLASKVL